MEAGQLQRTLGPIRLAVFFALALPGCAQPPGKEVEMAAARVALARESGAALFAGDLLREAETALESARRDLQHRERYLSAIQAAGFARLRAGEALALALERRRKMSEEATRLVREAAALLEESRSRATGAPYGARLEEFASRLAAQQSLLEAERPGEALDAGAKLKTDLLDFLRELKFESHRPR